MKKLEKIFRAFGNESRMKILKYVSSKKSASVVEIAKQNKLSYKATSKHLGILYQNDILDRGQSGFEMRYYISSTICKEGTILLGLL